MLVELTEDVGAAEFEFEEVGVVLVVVTEDAPALALNTDDEEELFEDYETELLREYALLLLLAELYPFALY